MLHSPVKKRQPTPQLSELEERVDDSLSSLKEILDLDPLDPNLADPVQKLVKDLKTRWGIYMKSSSDLTERYLKIASIEEAQACRATRQEVRTEVRQFISVSNGFLLKMNFDALSNIDGASVQSQPIVISTVEDANSKTLPPVVNISDIPVSEFNNCTNLKKVEEVEPVSVRPKLSVAAPVHVEVIGDSSSANRFQNQTNFSSFNYSTARLPRPTPMNTGAFGNAPRFSNFQHGQLNNSFVPSSMNFQPSSLQAPMNEATLYLIKQELFKESTCPFDGDSHRYKSWVMLLENRMKGLPLDPIDIITILIANTTKDPKKLVQDYLAAGAAFPTMTLQNIWEALNKQYGSPVTVSLSMQRKLQAVTEIRPPNVKIKLQELVHLCRIIESNMMTNAELEIFNLSAGQKQVWSKLPDWLQKKWRSEGHKFSSNHIGNLPPFSFLVDFIQYALDELSNPNFEQIAETRIVKNTYVTHNTDPNINESKTIVCLYHDKPGHSLIDCRSFNKLRVDEKQKFAADKRLCFKCLGKHMARDCDGNSRCSKCKRDHVTTMHQDGRSHSAKESVVSRGTDDKTDKSDKTTLCSVVCGNPDKAMSCSKTILCEIHHESNPLRTLKLYAIIDDMSDSSYISEKVVTELCLSGREETYLLSTMGSMKSEHKVLVIGGLWIRGENKDKCYSLPNMFTSNFIPGSTYEVGTPSIVKSIPHLARYANRFSELDGTAEPLILLGRDSGDLIKSVCFGRSSPFVCKTPLGYALIGSPCSNLPSKNRIRTVLKTSHEHYVSKPIIPKRDIGGAGVFDEYANDDCLALSRDDEKFISIVKNSIHVNNVGRITISLPFRNNDQTMPDNKSAVYGRTLGTLMKLKTQPSKLEQCTAAMAKSIEAGHVEQVPAEEIASASQGKIWYIPIFSVTQEKKKKTRLVFDSSAKYKGVSLNSVLLQGPDQNNRLRGVLMRFRMGEIAFGGDIEAMFYNFSLPPEDKDFLRFFWFKSNNPEEHIIQYRGCVHLFGNTCSPALAQAGLHFATLHPDAQKEPEAVQLITNNVYVDDLLAACRHPRDAIIKLEAVRNILDRYQIRLCKILSNSDEVVNHFPEAERAVLKEEIVIGGQSVHRTLGLAWKTAEDCFLIKVDIPVKPFTRRGMLAVSNSIYDPLGIVGPVVLQGKLIQRRALQKDCSSKVLDWDDPLSSEFADDWQAWLSSLSSIMNITLARSYLPPAFGEVSKYQLHTFTDASETAIGAVVYLRLVDNEDRVHVSYVISSSRLAPKSCVSMPRSELCAAVIGSRLFYEVKSELQVDIDDCFMYCDSKVVLAYIKNSESRFPIYVSHRVKAILKLTEPEQWHYINSVLNPADIACRPQSVQSLSVSVWLKGPDFLWDCLHDFGSHSSSDYSEHLLEYPMEKVNLKTVSLQEDIFCSVFDRVGTLNRLLSVVRSVILFCNILLRKIERCSAVPRSTRSELISLIVVSVQRTFYTDLVPTAGNPRLQLNHRLSSVDPFVDCDGVLRVGGRLKDSSLSYGTKHPIIVPADHPLSLLLVRHYHSSVQHQGRHLTLGAVRSAGFFIEKCAKLIRKVIRDCVACKKIRSNPSEQLMASLPESRVEQTSPFHNSGADVFGPFVVTDRKTTRQCRGTKKMWGLILTCMASRAIHIEPLQGLDTSSMANALRRFIAVRGTCRNIYSDRGTNFVGVKNQEDLSFDAIQKELSSKECTWHLNPPHASHFGGAWERKIGALKRVLEGSLLQLKGRILSSDELLTFLLEAACVENNTPMWEITSDPKDPFPITPACLLTLKDTPNPPPLQTFSSSDAAAYGARRWRRVQYLAECFWQRWRLYYLSGLQERSKWTRRRRNIVEGDVVLLRNKAEKRNCWPLAIVKATKKSHDGLVRTVTVETVNKSSIRKQFDRPISEIIVLVAKDELQC